MTRIYEEQSDLEPGQLRTDVSVLYCDPRGPYPTLVVDWWDDARDARSYAGPNPVIAHPPCGAWSNLRHLSRGDGKDCGPTAVEQVRRWGGVLEQPAGSALWNFCSLPRVFGNRDGHGGFAISVDQVSWGHQARKRTWLYFVGVDRALVRAGIRRDGKPTHWVSGNKYRESNSGGKMPPHIKQCSDQQRRRTPVAFARWLLDLAAQATSRELLEDM